MACFHSNSVSSSWLLCLTLTFLWLPLDCCFWIQFSGCSAEGMKKVYGKFCSRHNEAVNLYKDLHAKDKRFQAFIKVSTPLTPAPLSIINITGMWLDGEMTSLCLCRGQWAAASCGGSVFQSAFCWSLRGSPNILFWSRGYCSTLKVRGRHSDRSLLFI